MDAPTRDGHFALIDTLRSGPTSAKVPYPVGLREAAVLRTQTLSPTLLRLTFDGGRDFESHVPEEHIRLIFPDEHGELRLPERDGLSLRWPRPLPVSREYTVRRHDPATGELDVDIVLHAGGLAAEWARTVQPGERIHMAGPPGGFVWSEGFDRYLLAGDASALPQIARSLEALPRDARGWAFVDADRIAIDAPEQVEVTWLAGGLEAALRAVTLPAGERTFVWIAGEAGELKPIRRWVRELAPAEYHVTGYWKRGVADFDDEDR